MGSCLDASCFTHGTCTWETKMIYHDRKIAAFAYPRLSDDDYRVPVHPMPHLLVFVNPVLIA